AGGGETGLPALNEARGVKGGTMIPRHIVIGLAISSLLLSSVNPSIAQADRVGPDHPYPTPSTPGAAHTHVAQNNINETICLSGWTKTIRPSSSFTTTLKRKQLAALKLKDQDLSHYEEDHFISLELGGHPRDPRNLWPEMWGTPGEPLTSRGPFPAHLVGAKAKDRVENRLHQEVCEGTLTLKEAQDIIVTDWFKYYRDEVLK